MPTGVIPNSRPKVRNLLPPGFLDTPGKRQIPPISLYSPLAMKKSRGELIALSCSSAAGDQCRPARSLAGSEEVDGAVNAPHSGDAQGKQRFHPGAVPHEWTDQIERHACNVGEESEQRNYEVSQELELWMLVEAHDASQATQHVEQEGAEVRSQGDRQQRVRQGGHLVMRAVSKARPEAVRKRGNGRVRGSTGIAKCHDYCERANDGGDHGQRPDRAVRGQVAGVQSSHTVRKLFVFAHGVSDARSGVHTG